jgi:hypothetical protein
LFFEDEGRFGRINNIQKCWFQRGLRPAVKQQLVREFIYAFNSVCPQTGESFSLILPQADTNAMQYYMDKLSKQYPHYRIILCMDKAGWHTTKQLRLPQNIIVWFLPPYSPELNPVEMIWKHIRTKHFNNRIFDTLNDVEKQLSRSLKEVFVSIHETKQLTFYKWMQLN